MRTRSTTHKGSHEHATGEKTSVQFLMPAILALLTFLTFYPVIHNDFVNYDDHKLITRNPLIIQGKHVPVKDLLLKNFHSPHFKPLVLMSWNLEYRLSGIEPKIFHLNNLLLHVCNVLLVYSIGVMFAGMMAGNRRIRYGSWLYRRLPFVVAMLFALHPLHVETVAWACGRKDLLYALFYLISILCYLKYTDKGKPVMIILSAFMYLLVIGSKSMGITLPAVLFLIDKVSGRRLSFRILYEKSLHLAVLLFAFYAYGLTGSFNFYATGLTAGIVNQGFGSYPEHLADLPSGYVRILIISTRILLWIKHILIPAGLSPLYSEKILLDKSDYQIHFNIVFMAGLILSILLLRKKVPALVPGFLFFIITLSPALSIAERGMGVFIPDRYTYLPLIGILVPPITIITGYLYRKNKLRPLAYLLVVSVIICFSLTSYRLCTRWHDTETLWSYVLERHPEEAAAWNARGTFYHEKGDTIRALHDYNMAIAMDPTFYWAYNSRAKIYSRLGQLDEALRDFLLITRVDPWFTEAFTNLGAVYGLKGQYQLSLTALNRAHRLKPSDPDVLLNRGVTFFHLNDYENCIRDLNSYLHLRPDNAEVINTVGVCYLRLGQVDDAVIKFNQALVMKPNFEICRNNLRQCLREERGEMRNEK